MKKLNIVLVLLLISMLLTFGVFAFNGTIQKYVLYDNIQVKADDRLIGTGSAEPFWMDGTLYVSAQTAAEIARMGLNYDYATKTIQMTSLYPTTQFDSSQQAKEQELQAQQEQQAQETEPPEQEEAPQQSVFELVPVIVGTEERIYVEPVSGAPAAQPVQQPQQTVFGVGETWTVPGQWALTITGVRETLQRNIYAERSPGAVYIVDFTFTNLGYEHETLGGLFFVMDDAIVDASGVLGYSYPLPLSRYQQRTPAGATCIAQECIGVDTPGAFRLTVSHYDSAEFPQKHTATFVIDPPAASAAQAQAPGGAGGSGTSNISRWAPGVW